jgi:hypothetical protein
MAEANVSGNSFSSFDNAWTQNANVGGGVFGSIKTQPGSGGGDTTPPTVTYVNPLPGSQIRSDSIITIDVTDNSGGFATIQLRVQYRSAVPALPTETIYSGDSAGEFEVFYKGSTVSSITDGLRFVIDRDEGWPSTPTFVASPVDSSGNTT